MEDKYYVGFSLFSGIGPILFAKLLKKFGTAKRAWKSEEKELLTIIGEKKTENFLAFRETIDLEKELKKLVQKDVTVITLADKIYPKLLKTIPHPPFLLYVKGDVDILSAQTIGIVGTRKITEYGKRVTEMLTTELVAAGYCVVSGLAFGVDATAHMVTIQNAGKTIAVLGCGVDCCYPRDNQRVYDGILASGGAVISTFPVGMGATVGSFPARNAIIAGLSEAVLVTEGAADSGALITANYARKYNRPVFAVPGPITSSLSIGVNSLLKNGATAVTTAGDILDTLGIIKNLKPQMSDRKSGHGETKEEQEIVKVLQTGPLHFDEIARRIKKDSAALGSLLSLMELKGIIKSNGSIYSL